MFKRLLTLAMATCIIFLCSTTAFAADLMEDSRFYYKQSTGGTCTLTSAAMMLRRRAYLDGNEDWTSVTESSVRSSAWSDGLSWNFTYEGMTVKYGTLSSSGNTDELIALLEEHPEGIVAYNRNNPHAVLLTDYTDGVFYCADPAVAAGSGRIPFSSCTIAMSGVSCYWYISSNANEQLATEEVDSLTILGMFTPLNISTGSKFNLGGTLKTTEDDSFTEVTIKITDSNGDVIQEATDTPVEEDAEWAFRTLNSDILFAQLPTGTYAISVHATTANGETLTFASAFTVSFDATQTIYYWSNAENTSAA